MTNAPLLPAEAALLVEPSIYSAGKCLQATLLSLLGLGHLVIHESRGFFSTSRTLRLLDGDGRPLPPALAVVKNALLSHGRGRVLRSGEAVKALKKGFGLDYRQYVDDKLAPDLIERGLLCREQRKFLGLIPYSAYARTPSGEARAAPLIRLLEEAGGIRKLIKHDPDRAIRIARMAGVLLVLSPAAKVQIPKLKALMADRAADAGSGGGYVDDSADGSGWQLGIDFGSFDFSADIGGLLDGVGSVGDFTDGDGGGDGGDGGGGGD